MIAVNTLVPRGTTYQAGPSRLSALSTDALLMRLRL